MHDKNRGRQSINVFQITRPNSALLHYYVIVSLLTGPALPFVLVPLVCKYMTLRYHFDESGVSMSWGVLFRREVYLTYRRIQDIHLTRNLVQRWMGLATVSIQTASGSAGPEMAIEGILQAEALRDFLYSRMRGAADEQQEHASAAESLPQESAEALTLLGEIRDELRRLAAVRGASQ